MGILKFIFIGDHTILVARTLIRNARHNTSNWDKWCARSLSKKTCTARQNRELCIRRYLPD
jgi:hypothetical protein